MGKTSISVCPIAEVQAPVEWVWNLLAEPASYASWWNAETRAIEPPGRARPGQRINAQTRALGKRWTVHITVGSVDEDRRAIELTTRLPLGITVHNHIVCTPLDPATCRVTFG